MRLRVTEPGLGDYPAGAGPAEGQLADVALLGSWSATRWQYASKVHHEHRVDVVVGLRGSVTMSLSAGAFVITWDVPGREGGSIGGLVTVKEGELLLRPHGAGESDVVQYRLAALTLVLNGGESAWDFDGRGEEPADFVAVLVRL